MNRSILIFMCLTCCIRTVHRAYITLNKNFLLSCHQAYSLAAAVEWWNFEYFFLVNLTSHRDRARFYMTAFFVCVPCVLYLWQAKQTKKWYQKTLTFPQCKAHHTAHTRTHTYIIIGIIVEWCLDHCYTHSYFSRYENDGEK